jgi:hypothetical protein
MCCPGFIRYSLLFFFPLLFIVTSCKKKYPEGGNFSLISKKSRVANSWKIYSVKIDGKDSTSSFQSQHYKYNLVINTDGSYALMYFLNNVTITEAGRWSLVNENTRISFEHMNGKYEWEIVKLKNRELWVYDTKFYGVKTEIQLIPF